MRQKITTAGILLSIVRFLTRTKLRRILFLISVPAAIVAVALWQPAYAPPIFDAQVHYNEEAWRRVSVKAVINTAEELNVPWLLVASTPNEGTWQLYAEDPKRVIPMLVPYRTRDERETWFQNPANLRYIEQELARADYRGIGEFYLIDGQVNNPVVQGVVELARERGLILHARSDPNALRQLFALDPTNRVLWAHAGMFTPPATIHEMLDTFPNLYIEISHRGDVAPNGKLAPEWRALLLRYPQRFLLGSGTYTSEYWYQFRYILAKYRGWLTSLPPNVMVRVAYQNGLDLFGIPDPIRQLQK